ncbi:hypothetical protein DYBT9275_05843 [Dyadobacter sp. CECT 9275]|uniref:RloB domain-containing protein n=1 Tax=Dyadobacter helix TaxID=2822344 RepID=A0A916NE63_9BACT|nr:RloB family protein [Dyadobacter sp. CECT 9275]CAG5017771.1 hypothetical protein DYBT9275_05843 [Dyadobacter sp. CECT 9275]
MRKKRGYKRDTPVELVRDYKLFAIACEGQKTEPAYFNLFRHFSRKLSVDIIEEIVTEAELTLIHANKSAPKWVLDRAIKYVEREGLNEEDELWFVMDIDRWSEDQIREIAYYCDQHANWNLVLSNPCFEVWLYLHKKSEIELIPGSACQEYKSELANLELGGYHPLKFIEYFKTAILHAKVIDSQPDHYFPKLKETKVYLLAEAILKSITENDFNNFLNEKLPNLIDLQIVKKGGRKR